MDHAGGLETREKRYVVRKPYKDADSGWSGRCARRVSHKRWIEHAKRGVRLVDGLSTPNYKGEFGASDRVRTDDLNLGKVPLCQLSYTRYDQR
jgi:hypothetical protein